MADDDLNFEFEAQLEQPGSNALPAVAGGGVDNRQLDPAIFQALPTDMLGQQLATFRKNFKKTVCTYWLRGMCMKGDACGFLHQYDVERMPVCRNLLRHGECKDIDCPFKHDMQEVKECNMYRLGFCIYGPQCRFKHRPLPGPPPPVEQVEAAKPREMRDINRVVSSVNPTVQFEDFRSKQRQQRDWGNDNDPNKRPRALPWTPASSGVPGAPPRPPSAPLALPAPPSSGPTPPGGPTPPNSRPPFPPGGPQPPPGGPRPPPSLPPPGQQQQQQGQQPQGGLGFGAPPPGPRPPPGGPRPPPGPPPPHFSNPNSTSTAGNTGSNAGAGPGPQQQQQQHEQQQQDGMPNIMQQQQQQQPMNPGMPPVPGMGMGMGMGPMGMMPGMMAPPFMQPGAMGMMMGGMHPGMMMGPAGMMPGVMPGGMVPGMMAPRPPPGMPPGY